MTSSPRETSARNLLIFAGVLTLAGFAVGSPVGGLACFLLAGIFALVGLCLGTKIIRATSLILLLMIGSLMLVKTPDAKSNYSKYLKRVEEHSSALKK